MRRYERNRRAYEGVIEMRSEAAKWTHKLPPPYAEHIIETTVASLLDERLRFRVRPKPRLWNDAEELRRVELGAKAFEILLGQQLAQTRFHEKQRQLVLQERLSGLGVAKVYWRSSTRMRKRLVWPSEPGSYPLPVETEEPDTAFDGPCVDVVDVRDFFWDDAASSLDECGVVAHRIWVTFAEAKAFERAGAWRNVDELKQHGRDFSAAFDERSASSEQKRGRIEVLEIWRRERDNKIRVYTVGQRSVELAQRDHPFWHGEMPFVVFAAQPKPFRIPGRPQIEKIAALQEALWSLGNQRLDNLELINNAVVLMREDMDDPEAFQFFPGAVNTVSSPQDVVLWQPDARAAEVSIPAEQMLKQDMQNLAGGFPFTSTSEARTAQANTATEASLVASIAQRSIVTAKTMLYYAYERIGQQLVELDGQLVREPTYVQAVGIDEPGEVTEILPQMLQGDWLFSVDPMSESIMRQERRAEALSFFQTLLQSAQVNAMLAAQGFMRPLDWERVYRDLLEAYDKVPDGYFKQGPAPQLPGQGMGTPPQPGQQPQNGQPQGVTNPQLAAGPGSPAHPASMSPLAARRQRFAAGSGASNA